MSSLCVKPVAVGWERFVLDALRKNEALPPKQIALSSTCFAIVFRRSRSTSRRLLGGLFLFPARFRGRFLFRPGLLQAPLQHRNQINYLGRFGRFFGFFF